MKQPSILEMLQAGLHFGHQSSRWYPKMKSYIFTQRNGIHVIDLEQTAGALEKILPQVKQMAIEGKTILFVTTKPQGKDIIKQAAIECGMPYLVDRWIGGLITNFPEIKKLIRQYVTLKDKQSKGELDQYTKKEQLEIAKKLKKMDQNLLGLANLDKLPDALFIPSVQREKTAVTEANRKKIPIIGVCDTNANPNKVQYMIPANDDAIKSIALMAKLVSDAINEGKKEAVTKKAEETK